MISLGHDVLVDATALRICDGKHLAIPQSGYNE